MASPRYVQSESIATLPIWRRRLILSNDVQGFLRVYFDPCKKTETLALPFCVRQPLATLPPLQIQYPALSMPFIHNHLIGGSP